VGVIRLAQAELQRTLDFVYVLLYQSANSVAVHTATGFFDLQTEIRGTESTEYQRDWCEGSKKYISKTEERALSESNTEIQLTKKDA